MLLASLDLLFRDPATFMRYVPLLLLLVVVAVTVGIAVHEASHAFAAYSMGDGTARRQGRLTLNPLAHLDPAGTLMLLLAGFGWGKPVPVDQEALSWKRLGMSLVALAGPVSNLATAFVLALPIKLGVIPWHSPRLFDLSFRGAEDIAADVLGFVIFFNLVLAMFNLIPLAPLDGSKVVMGLLPKGLAGVTARLEQYGPAVLLIVIIMDYATGRGFIWQVMGPAVNYLRAVATGT